MNWKNFASSSATGPCSISNQLPPLERPSAAWNRVMRPEHDDVVTCPHVRTCDLHPC